MLSKSVNISKTYIDIALVGDPGVGKSSIIERFANGTYSDNSKTTINPDFKLKQA